MTTYIVRNSAKSEVIRSKDLYFKSDRDSIESQLDRVKELSNLTLENWDNEELSKERLLEEVFPQVNKGK